MVQVEKAHFVGYARHRLDDIRKVKRIFLSRACIFSIALTRCHSNFLLINWNRHELRPLKVRTRARTLVISRARVYLVAPAANQQNKKQPHERRTSRITRLALCSERARNQTVFCYKRAGAQFAALADQSESADSIWHSLALPY